MGLTEKEGKRETPTGEENLRTKRKGGENQSTEKESKQVRERKSRRNKRREKERNEKERERETSDRSFKANRRRRGEYLSRESRECIALRFRVRIDEYRRGR